MITLIPRALPPLLLPLLLLGLSAACSPVYDHTELLGETSAALDYALGETVELPEGIALGVSALPRDTGGNPWPEPDGDQFDEFDLRSEDPTVLEVIRVPTAEVHQSFLHFGRDPVPLERVFVFVAHQPGQTTLLITLAGETMERIPAEVVPQPLE